MKLVNIIFGSFGVLGVLITIILYFRSKKERKPIFEIDNFVIIENSLSDFDGIEFLYRLKPISEFAEVYVAFYNGGKQVILDSELTKLEPIRVEINNGELLSKPSILYKSNETTQLNIYISDDKRKIFINFNYLEKNDGIVFKFFTNTSKLEDIKLLGKIKGVHHFYNNAGKLEGLRLTHGIINTAEDIFGPGEPTLTFKIITLIIQPILIIFAITTIILDLIGLLLSHLLISKTDVDIFKNKFRLYHYKRNAQNNRKVTDA